MATRPRRFLLAVLSSLPQGRLEMDPNGRDHTSPKGNGIFITSIPNIKRWTYINALSHSNTASLCIVPINL